jgi:hypothetical protein
MLDEENHTCSTHGVHTARTHTPTHIHTHSHAHTRRDQYLDDVDAVRNVEREVTLLIHTQHTHTHTHTHTHARTHIHTHTHTYTLHRDAQTRKDKGRKFFTVTLVRGQGLGLPFFFLLLGFLKSLVVFFIFPQILFIWCALVMSRVCV